MMAAVHEQVTRMHDFLRREFDIDYMLERALAHGATQHWNRALLNLRERLNAIPMENVRAGCSPQLGDWTIE